MNLSYSIISLWLIVLITLTLGACASGPIVDLKGVDKAKYEQDLQECEALAEQVSTGQNVAKSALAGALLGGVVGALDDDAGSGAAAGGVLGVAGGTKKAQDEKRTVLFNCLKHRGYAVLN